MQQDTYVKRIPEYEVFQFTKGVYHDDSLWPDFVRGLQSEGKLYYDDYMECGSGKRLMLSACKVLRNTYFIDMDHWILKDKHLDAFVVSDKDFKEIFVRKY